MTHKHFSQGGTQKIKQENLRNQYSNYWNSLTCKNFVSNRFALVRFLISVKVHYILRPMVVKVFLFLAITHSKKYIKTQYSKQIYMFHRARLTLTLLKFNTFYPILSHPTPPHCIPRKDIGCDLLNQFESIAPDLI